MFVRNQPAMKIGSSLVIADLHLGIEDELNRNGVNIADQTSVLLKNILSLVKKTRAKEIILLGDIKNSIYIKKEDRFKIPFFLNKLGDRIKVLLIKGNHDGRIEKLAGKNIEVCSFVKRGCYLLTHGHKKIPKKLLKDSKTKSIIIGHNHSGIRFRDRFGVTSTEPCWVIGTTKTKAKKQVILMPAFNPLVGAIAINKDGVLGPVAKSMRLDNAKIYLLDGTYLGHLRMLESNK